MRECMRLYVCLLQQNETKLQENTDGMNETLLRLIVRKFGNGGEQAKHKIRCKSNYQAKNDSKFSPSKEGKI